MKIISLISLLTLIIFVLSILQSEAAHLQKNTKNITNELVPANWGIVAKEGLTFIARQVSFEVANRIIGRAINVASDWIGKFFDK